MAAHNQILDTYGSIADKSGEMLNAARSSDWDRLVALERDCRALATTLRRLDTGPERPDDNYLKRKAAYIRKVLADDAAIRQYTEPWMNQLDVYLGNARQESRLRQAYDNDPDN